MLNTFAQVPVNTANTIDLLVGFESRYHRINRTSNFSDKTFKNGQIVRLLDADQFEPQEDLLTIYRRMGLKFKITALGYDEATSSYFSDSRSVRKYKETGIEWHDNIIKNAYSMPRDGYYVSEVETAFAILNGDRESINFQKVQEGALMIVIESDEKKEYAEKFTKTYPTVKVGYVSPFGVVEVAKVAVCAIQSADIPYEELPDDLRI